MINLDRPHIPTFVIAEAVDPKAATSSAYFLIPGEWDVDESNAGSLVLLRRTLFKYKGVTDWMNFSNEPYICGDPVEGGAPLLRASWTSKRYLGYAGRTGSTAWPRAPTALGPTGSWTAP